MLLCLIAYLAQKNSTYSQKFALVVKKAPVYTLPTTISEKSNFELTPGTDVQIEENRHNWKRIRNEESEGWVKGNVVQSLCPYK
jgi:SH3-like domain-containing protein